MPPNVNNSPTPTSRTARQSARPTTNDAKAERIVGLVLNTAMICGWNADAETVRFTCKNTFMSA